MWLRSVGGSSKHRLKFPYIYLLKKGGGVFLRWHSGKEYSCQCRKCKRLKFYPGLGRSPGGGNGNLLQYSCLENSMDRGAWWATVYGVAKSGAQLINWAHKQLLWEREGFFLLCSRHEHIERSTKLHSNEINLGSLHDPEPITMAMVTGPPWVSLDQAGLI